MWSHPLRLQWSTPKRGDKKSSRGRQIFSGEFLEAFAGADSAALRRRAVRADKALQRQPRCPVAWLLRVPNDHLVFENDAERFFDALANVGDKGEHILRGGFACVYKKIGVTVANAGIAHVEPLEA